MKKLLFTILAIMFAANISNADIELLVSEYNNEWNDDAWVLSGKDSLVYDMQYRLIYKISAALVEGNWQSDSQVKYEYPQYDEIITTWQFYADGEWVNEKSTHAKYLNDSSYSWIENRENIEGEMQRTTREEYEYFGNGMPSKIEYFVWLDGKWVTERTDEFILTPDERIKLKLTQKIVDGNAVDERKLEYFYEIDSESFYIVLYLNEDGEWKPSWRYLFDFPEMQQTVLTSQANGTEWTNFWQEIYTYDEEGNEIGYVFQKWIDLEWVNISQDISEFVGDKIQNKVYQYWDNAWVNQNKVDYNYKLISAVAHEFDSKISHVQVFPNPASTNLDVVFFNERSSEFNIDLFDINGRKVMNSQKMFSSGLVNYSIDVSRLTTGSYFIRLSNGKQSKSTKFTVK
jgi:archaellum component FlaF (FlaF/FlaG flagellin family)